VCLLFVPEGVVDIIRSLLLIFKIKSQA
jgi:hypothetical protein